MYMKKIPATPSKMDVVENGLEDSTPNLTQVEKDIDKKITDAILSKSGQKIPKTSKKKKG